MAESLLQSRVDTIRRFTRRGAAAPLSKVVAKSRPEDLAAAMIHLYPSEQRFLFAQIQNDALAAEVLVGVGEADFQQLIKDMTLDRLAALFQRMEMDDQTDALERLNEETRAAVLTRIKGEEREQVEELLGYAPDTAGGIMSPLAFRLQEDCTCREAIAAVQEASDREQIYYVYVENEAEQLTGVVSLRNLLTHAPSTLLSEIMMRDVIAVTPQTDQEEVARIAGRYALLAVPVVDSSRKLVGIVTVDDVIDVIREEAAEDMLLMAGVSDEAAEAPVSRFQALVQRIPWLIVTLLGGLLISEIIHRFDPLLSQELVLAGFIPIVMGMEGNVGIQSATLTVRSIATGRLDGPLLPAVAGEIWTGFAMGVFFGVLIGAYCLIRYQNIYVAASVAVAVICGMSSAAFVGTAVPLSMRRLGIDPAIATGPFVTTAMDGVGISIYLGIAAMLLHYRAG